MICSLHLVHLCLAFFSNYNSTYHTTFIIFFFFFFFNDTATTEIYTLSLHDALPICSRNRSPRLRCTSSMRFETTCIEEVRSEEHTSELQSLRHLVCRLLLEKKKKKNQDNTNNVIA